MSDTWRGRFPITTFILQALEAKAAASSVELSRREKILITACRFWVAVGSQQVATLLGSQAERRMRAAYVAFSAIGAIRVTSMLRVMIRECPAQPTPDWIREHAAFLEERAVQADDAIDKLISDYAQNSAGEGAEPPSTPGGKPKFPPPATDP